MEKLHFPDFPDKACQDTVTVVRNNHQLSLPELQLGKGAGEVGDSRKDGGLLPSHYKTSQNLEQCLAWFIIVCRFLN